MKNVYTLSSEIQALGMTIDCTDDPKERQKIFEKRKKLQLELFQLQGRHLMRARFTK